MSLQDRLEAFRKNFERAGRHTMHRIVAPDRGAYRIAPDGLNPRALGLSLGGIWRATTGIPSADQDT